MYKDRTKRKKGWLGLISSLISTAASVGMNAKNSIDQMKQANREAEYNRLSTNIDNNIKSSSNLYNLYNNNNANNQSLEEKISLHDNIYSRLGTKVSKGNNVSNKQFDRMRLQQQYACGGKYRRK